MTILIAIDKDFGGFYIHRGFTWRLCLGFISLTIVPIKEQTILEFVTRDIYYGELAEEPMH